MSASEPREGVLRTALLDAERRLRSVTGIGELDEVEARLASLEEAVHEDTALGLDLARLLDDVEARLVPLLEDLVAHQAPVGDPSARAGRGVAHVIGPAGD